MAVTKEILSLAVETGDALLRNGAEVYRVEDTVMHILKAYEIEEYDVYVLSNGIFASANTSWAYRSLKPAFEGNLFPRMFPKRCVDTSG